MNVRGCKTQNTQLGVRGIGSSDPEAEWHFDIRKMAAILHNLEERRGSNAVQNCMISVVFRWTIRSVSFDTVQRFLVRTSRHSLVVRPHTLTPYVLTPFERTSPEPTPYVQRIFGRRIWCFVPYGCYFFTLREARICSCGQPRLILSHFQGVSEYQNDSKMHKSVA